MGKFKRISIFALLLIIINIHQVSSACQQCYNENQNKNCDPDPYNISAYTLHMSVHPHLDAFWIFDFQSYYNPNPSQSNVHGYFASNRFNSVKQIFDTATNVLTKSKQIRQKQGPSTQKAHRSFFNSQMCFLKRWYYEQNQQKKQQVKKLLKTKYWQVLGGGWVEHDQGCAYYDDIIENFQTGNRFLKQQFGYYPRVAISADSFGHSSTTLAILAHMGIQGFFVQRSDQHILLKNKTQFIWKAKSANGQYYGALPTHIRWAIHGFEDQFIGGNINEQICKTKANYIGNLQRQNQFLKRILKSNHIMRYFGHDFQRFDEYSYAVIEGMMQKFSMQKCNRVTAVYGNPTQYFMTLMSQVFNKVKPAVTREEDIMPIWDYDSGLYWTGYYTTDPYHKKNYRDAGRFLHATRKAFTPLYISNPNSTKNKQAYKLLQQFAQTVSYLQHHDGVSGTSKYSVMDQYATLSNDQIKKIKQTILKQVFELQFPSNINNKILQCSLESECQIPEQNNGDDIYLKIIKTGGERLNQPIIVHLRQNQYYQPNCEYQINCLCTGFPCSCDLHLYPKMGTYNLVKLKKVANRPKDAFLLRKLSENGRQDQSNRIKYNQTHITITHSGKEYSIGYKRLNGDPTPRTYDHLSRYGDQFRRSFTIRSGKYALGNDIKKQKNLSKIKKAFIIQTDYLVKYIIHWSREHMKTIITIPKHKPNQWKVQTLSSAQTGKLQDLYLQVCASHINNNKKFYTDSNGWLVMKRQLFKHEDYEAHFSPEGFDDINGNSYPMTTFVFIQDQNNKQNKLSINTDRAQGVTAYRPGTIWINYDRLSSDDGKWVYETTYRSEYQRYVHYITVENTQNNERVIQKIYDEPLLIQGHSTKPSESVSQQQFMVSTKRAQWQKKVGFNKVKFSVKPWNDSTLLLRVQNMKDFTNATVQLFSEDRVCTFLTAYYGNQIKFESVYQSNIVGHVNYNEFIQKKWNWDSVINLKKQNQIFDKTFAQKITLRPLQIRTFVFKNVSIDKQNCRQVKDLKYTGKSQSYRLDTNKLMPIRSELDKRNQKRIIQYLLNQDKCNKPSPVKQRDSSQTAQPQKRPQSKEQKNMGQWKFERQPEKKIPQNNLRPDVPVPNPTKPQTIIKNNQQQMQTKTLDLAQIKQKIKNKKPLTISQKQKFFKQKLSSIKSEIRSIPKGEPLKENPHSITI